MGFGVSVQNPDFQAFDLSEWGPAVTRLEKLTVKVWCHLESGWTLLLEAEVELSELTFLGRNVSVDTESSPALTDG